MKADPNLEAGYLSCGIIVLLLSFVSVWWSKKHSDKLFPCELDSNDDQTQSNTNERSHAQSSECPIAPARTNRRISRQALTQSVNGSEPVEL